MPVVFIVPVDGSANSSLSVVVFVINAYLNELYNYINYFNFNFNLI
jgi:hypothetical protein